MKRNVNRNFYPGDEWIYFKIYGGIKMCDDLMCGQLYNLIIKLKQKGLINQWFFIRYGDPEFHIRLRLNVISMSCIGDIIMAVNNLLRPYCQSRLIHKFVIDTYERELERYGGSLIDLCEQLFCIDSECVCSVLQQVKSSSPDIRWQTAFFSVDSFLTALGYDIHKKLDLVAELSCAFRDEFGFNSRNGKQLNTIYRNHRQSIEQSIRRSEAVFSTIIQVIKQRNSVVTSCAAQYAHQLNIASILHMMMNRHFDSCNRANELLIYDFLKRYYKSCIARGQE